MKISKLRKKLKNRKFVNNLLDGQYRLSEYLNHFRKFECSAHFKGEHVADKNYKKYLKDYSRNERHIRLLKYILTKQGESK